MAFKTRPPGKSPQKTLVRSKPLQTKAPMKPGTGFTASPPSPADQRKAQQKALQKATLRVLEKARKEAAERGVDLSEWEAEFLDSVSERVKTAELLNRIIKDRSVLVIEHDMKFVEDIAHKVTVLHQGQILSEGSMDTVKNDPKVIEVYLGH